MRIFIADYDNADTPSIVYHYNKLGHEVYFQRPGTKCLDWKKVRTWTTAFFLNYSGKLNAYDFVHNFKPLYGEDITMFEIDEMFNLPYLQDIRCEYIDIENTNIKFDAFHTPGACQSFYKTWVQILSKHQPQAKWINGTISHFDHSTNGAKNICRYLPANFSNEFKHLNSISFYRNEFEIEYLRLDIQKLRVTKKENVISSFNHNFSVRHKTDYEIFCKFSDLMKSYDIDVVNYGGNIRGQGADMRYSGVLGITGNFETITPRDAIQKYASSKAVIHLKNYDWAGGVPANCRFVGAPMMTTNRYIRETNSQILLDDSCCLVADDAESLSRQFIEKRDNLNSYKIAMIGKNDLIFTDAYWNSWHEFLSKLTLQ